jgi:anaerobilin synthase
MIDHPKQEHPFAKLPKMWIYLYPYLQGGLEHSEETVRRFLQQENVHRPGKKALYVHIPFCDTICTFCPFVRSTNYHDKLQPYVDALQKELQTLATTPYVQQFELDAIFFGGGTPSVLSPQMIETLCTTIRDNFKIADDCEWSFEVEAKSASEDKLKAMAANGVNRISFGVQTLDPHFRKMFNLTASYEEIQRTRDLGEKYFKAFNMDLLYQLPGQSLADVEDDLKRAFALNTTSIDAYPLDYMITSKGFLNSIKNGKIALPPNANDKLVQQEFVTDYMLQNGFEQAFIYTFIRKQAAHNRFVFGETLYGQFEDEFIAAGQSGVSYLCGVAYRNMENTADYIKAVEERGLSVEHANEYTAKEKGLIYLPKRMRMSLHDLHRQDLEPHFHDKVATYLEAGLLRQENEELVLTELGKKWYMNMMIDLMPSGQRDLYDRVVGRLDEERQFLNSQQLTVLG